MPPFLMGAVLLFWGWRCGILVWALIAAILVELPNFISLRWEFSLADLRRIVDLCILLGVAEVAVIYSSAERISSEMSLKFSQWLPLPLYPLMLAQAFGTLEKIPLSVLSVFLRRDPDSPMARKSFNVSYLYFAICLMAAGAVSLETPFFYPAVVLLVGYALWSVHPRRPTAFSIISWFVLIGLASGIGFVGHHGLRAAQGNLEEMLSAWVNLHWRRESDPRESFTAIGRKGHLAQSAKIILRVTPEATDSLPPLLNEANYCIYSNGVWRVEQNDFRVYNSDTNDEINLLSPKRVSYSIRIAKYLKGGGGLLPLPRGAFELDNIPAILGVNNLGTVKLENGPGLLDCTVFYGPGESIYGRTNEFDFQVPTNELAVLSQIVAELNLNDPRKTEAQKIQAITRFFKGFAYTLEVTAQATGQKTALGQFLTATKTGHCEYFATATTLLLRLSGIPARYSTGYSINENSRSGETVLVRERHAHAWTSVYRREFHRWEDLDTTPVDVAGYEKSQDSFWQTISDTWSNLLFEFAKWRTTKAETFKNIGWLLVPLILFFLWRVLFNRGRRKQQGKAVALDPLVVPGRDSDFYRIEKCLSEAGMNRLPYELFHEWLGRLSLPERELLNHILELHRRLRFDPNGLNAAERETLKLEVDHWLDAFANLTVVK